MFNLRYKNPRLSAPDRVAGIPIPTAAAAAATTTAAMAKLESEPVESGGDVLVLAQADDRELLAKMGYQQELRRQYSTLQIFAIAFSIMGLVPSIASTLAFSLPAGPAGMVWGWFTASILIFFVGLTMADMASAMPTAGGLYWWTHYFAGDQYKNPLSFLVGYSNTLGLIGGICSVDYTLSLMILACVSIARDGNWTASQGTIYGLYAGLICVHAISTILASHIMPRIQTFCIYINIAIVIATVIALPVGKVARGGTLNPGSYVFGHVENSSNWPTGWTFVLAFLSPIWSIGFFDSCVHMSEEAMHAARAVPKGILFSAGSACVLGFLLLSVIAASMDPNVANTLGSTFGQPMAQVYYDALGKTGALGFMAVLIFIQFLIGLSLIVAASRQTWAFSRDGALPFSSFFRQISRRIRYQPVNAILGLAAVCIVFGLLCLINSVAANALFSLFVASNYVAWGTPILCRLLWGAPRFQPGEFYTGKLSRPIAWVAVVWLVFGLVLSMFPSVKNPQPNDMNYTIAINGFVWIACMLYYFLFARKWFRGPQTTLQPGMEQ
ncbi:GABA permease (Uga4) [Aspergillus ochraceoroseus]|uniref:GABA permease (Uga4) n=2 Tax=Aspergillus ochraceoroseus TaxID=138278 RepID=A0A0F8U0P7_9EURO|nr:GABA permease (Uga4) [Aspergillus ochraceoroseus]